MIIKTKKILNQILELFKIVYIYPDAIESIYLL